MKTTVYVVKVRDTILETTRLDIAFEREGDMYHGALFTPYKDFKQVGKRALRYLDSVVVETTDKDSNDLAVYQAYMQLCQKHGIKIYASTYDTLQHWSFLNGFTDIYHRQFQ